MHLKKMCILLLSDRMLFKYQLRTPGPMYHLRPGLCFLTDFLSGWCAVGISGMLKSSTVAALLSVSPSVLTFALYIKVLLYCVHI